MPRDPELPSTQPEKLGAKPSEGNPMAPPSLAKAFEILLGRRKEPPIRQADRLQGAKVETRGQRSDIVPVQARLDGVHATQIENVGLQVVEGSLVRLEQRGRTTVPTSVFTVLKDIARADEQRMHSDDFLRDVAARLRDTVLADTTRAVGPDARTVLGQLIEAVPDKPWLRTYWNEMVPTVAGGAGGPPAPEGWIDRDHLGARIPESADPRVRGLVRELREAGTDPLRQRRVVELYDKLTELPQVELIEKIEHIRADRSIDHDEALRQIEEAGREADALRLETDPYRERVRQLTVLQHAGRWNPTNAQITRIQTDAVYRDEVFYELLTKLFDNPNEEARKLIGLYEDADLDRYMEIISDIGRAPTADDPPGTKRDGDYLRALFETRKATIMQLHDVDYWARHGSGDIKSYQPTVARVQNYMAKDALSDPYVQEMKNAYEKAILFIRNSHDGYLPPELFEPDVLHGGGSAIDEIAEQFFIKKVMAGEIYDVARDVRGVPLTDAQHDGRVFQLGDQPINAADLIHQRLRLRGTQEMARGMLVLEMRTLEIAAMSKTPGADHALWGTPAWGPQFSSKIYGQLARHFNPVIEWFAKYRQGKTLHHKFFQSLVEGKRASHWWEPNRWREAMDAVTEGRFEELFPDSKRLVDMAEAFSFSGRWGPMSLWGIKDATLGWTDQMRERLGGSIRMALSRGWAEGQVKDRFMMEHGVAAGTTPRQELLREWNKQLATEGSQVHHEIENRMAAHRTWLWVQTTMRAPTIVAGHLRERVMINGRQVFRPVRDRIIGEIFGDANFMEDYYRKAYRSPGDEIRAKLACLVELEGDVEMIQQKARNMREGKPRDIVESDFDILPAGERRDNAKIYWQRTQRAILGAWSAEEWYQRLGVSQGYRDGTETEISFAHWSDMDGIFQAANEVSGDRPPLLNKKMTIRKMMQHISTEDCQWRFLDVSTLGPPQWNRRAGDLAARIEANQKEMAFLDLLTGKPKVEDLVKSLGEVLIAEQGHDPKEGYKMVSYFTKALIDVYGGDWRAIAPGLGKLIPRVFHVALSPAQEAFGPEHADAWGPNNKAHLIDELVDKQVLPEQEFDGDEYWGEYTGHHLKKMTGATKVWQIIEMGIVGWAIANLLIIGVAGGKSVTSLTDRDKD